ncbi:MAG: hypothetical protein ACYSWX_16850 [Planctomycetota bacterium]|jgi:hypothetical protein
MLWNALSIVVGLAVGMVVNMALITLNSKVLYPAPEDLDFKDTEKFQAYVDTLPAPAFLVVMAAHLGQAFFGGLVAAWMAKSHPIPLALTIGAISMLGGIMMMRTVKGPTWMLIELPLYLALAYLAGSIVEGMRAGG